MFNLKTINTSIHSFKFSIHIAVNNEVCMFISAMVISLPWPWGFTPSFLVQSSAVWEAPTDQVSLKLVGAGLGQLSVVFVEQRFEYTGGQGPVALRTPPGSFPTCIGRGMAQWRWALPNPHSNTWAVGSLCGFKVCQTCVLRLSC